MLRRNLFLATLVSLTLGLTAGDAVADRLGSGYRGPDDNAAQDTTSSDESADDEGGGETLDEGPGKGETESGDGGLSTGDGGGDSGGGDSGGDGGGDTGGAPDSGGDGGGDSGGGTDLGDTGGGNTGRSADSGGPAGDTGGGGVGAGAGGGFGGRGKTSAAAAQEPHQRVLWYFEHNREHYLNLVAKRRGDEVGLRPGSAAQVFGYAPEYVRERSPVTAEDRERIFDLLIKHLSDSESVVRDAAVLGLGKLGTAEAVEALIKHLETEDSRDVRQDTLLALGISRSPAAVPVLVQSLGKRNLASFALIGLGLVGDEETCLAPILDYIDAQKKMSKHEDELASACLALGALGSDGGVDVLEKIVKDTRRAPEVVRVYAAHALGRIGGEDAMKALEKSLGRSKSVEVERAIVLALGNSTDPGVLKKLAGKDGIGNSADQLGRGFAAVSMGRILARVPQDDWKRYPDAVVEMALSPQKGNVPAQYANLSLSLFDGFDEEAEAQYQEWLEERRLQRDTLSSLAMAAGIAGKERYHPFLVQLAESAGMDGKTRGYAALGASMLGQSGESAQLLRRLFKESEDMDVKRSALYGLGLVGDRRDVKFLVDTIAQTKDDGLGAFTRGAAVVALGQIRDGESVGEIQKLLSRSDPRTRAFAVAALGYLADKDDTPYLASAFADNNFRREFPTLKVLLRHL